MEPMQRLTPVTPGATRFDVAVFSTGVNSGSVARSCVVDGSVVPVLLSASNFCICLMSFLLGAPESLCRFRVSRSSLSCSVMASISGFFQESRSTDAPDGSKFGPTLYPDPKMMNQLILFLHRVTNRIHDRVPEGPRSPNNLRPSGLNTLNFDLRLPCFTLEGAFTQCARRYHFAALCFSTSTSLYNFC